MRIVLAEAYAGNDRGIPGLKRETWGTRHLQENFVILCDGLVELLELDDRSRLSPGVHGGFHGDDMIVALVRLGAPSDQNDRRVVAQSRTVREVPHV